MTSQWPPQYQQYQQAPQYQQPPQYPPPQQYQQSQHSQASQQYQPPQQHQSPQQYQPPQQYQQAQHYQPPLQYQQTQQYPQAQQAQYQQPNQYSVQPPQNQQAHPYQSQNVQVSPHQHQQPPQQWSQPQHYQRYPQAGQNNQAQVRSYQQHPEPQAQQQGISDYQQQHPAQQYHSQQLSTQQQSSSQHVAYQQPHQQSSLHYYQQQSSPISSQGPTPVTPHSCYNCGIPNHFTQDCTQPKRAITAGALGSRNFSKALQRSKPSTPVINNSSPLHSGGSQAVGYSQGYPPSNYGSNGHAERQVQQSPVTPASAQTIAHQQAWQQYWQWQTSHQQEQSQHQQGPVQEQSYSQQNHVIPSAQTAGYNGYHQQPSSAHPYNQDTQVYPLQLPHGQNRETPVDPGISTHYDPQQSAQLVEETEPSQPQSRAPSFSMRSQPMSKNNSQQEETTEDVDEIDLDLLDIPDLPEETSHSNRKTFLPNTVVSPPVSLIGMPLPANFVVADALYPIPPPAPETQGCCQSKYLRDNVSETLCTNIKQSRYWKDHKDDTAFLERPNEEDIVPVDEIRAQIKQRYIDGEAPDDRRRQSRSESRSSFAFKKDSADTRTRLEQLEVEKAETLAKIAAKERQRALKRGEQVSPSPSTAVGTPGAGQATVKEEQITPSRSAISEKPVTSQQSTEDVLAALGVTGAPKPVVNSRAAYNVSMYDQPNGSRTGPTKLQGNPQSRSAMSYSPDTRLPPPPPLPMWQQPLLEGVNGSPSISPTFTNGHNFNSNGAEPQHSYYTNGADAVVAFTNEAIFEQSSTRKRSFNRRDSSSSEEDVPARRQEDDVTPKFKRHQPKVAAAYSRRW